MKEQIAAIVDEHLSSLGPPRYVYSRRDPEVQIPISGVADLWKPILVAVAKLLTRDAIGAHPSYRTFHTALTSFRPETAARFFESGSSAYGADSTRLLSKVAASIGCGFDTVDLNPDTAKRASDIIAQQDPQHRTQNAHCSDSVAFLQNSPHNYCFAYLDSFDLVPGSYGEAAQHGLKEFLSLKDKLTPGAVVLIDDTPKCTNTFRVFQGKEQEQRATEWLNEHGSMPGKGADVLAWVRRNTGFDVLEWGYQLVLRYNPE